MQQLRAASAKIVSVLPDEQRKTLDRSRRRTRVLQRSSDYSRHFDGAHLMTLQAAVADRQLLHLRYFSNVTHAIGERDVEPLGLLFYGDHWHLVAYCRWRQDYRDFRTDRIHTLAVTGRRFRRRAGHTWERFLEDFSSRPPGESVLLRVPCELAEYIVDKSHYWLVERIASGDSVRLSYRVPSLDAVAGWLMAFGDRIDVLHPPRLRSRLAAHGRRLARHHGRRPADAD